MSLVSPLSFKDYDENAEAGDNSFELSWPRSCLQAWLKMCECEEHIKFKPSRKVLSDD